MKKCFWITSYPKSGNTWLRLIIGGLFFTDNGKIENFEVLKKIPKIDFNGNSLSIKQTEEIVEKRFSKEKKKKRYSSAKRNRSNSERDYKTKGNFRNKRKNKRKNKRF